MNTINSDLLILILIILLLGLFLIFFIYGLDNRLQTTKYILPTKKINKPIRVVFLSDLHSCKYGKNQEDLINAVKANQPDLILLGGDIIDDKLPIKPAFQLLEGIVDQAPSFYVSGNHEAYTGKLDSLKLALKKIGVVVLEGDREKLEINNSFINIIGLDDPFIGESSFKKQLARLEEMNNLEFTLFLTHHPERIDDYNKVQSDLILAGHAHGGQWRVPYILPGLFAPHQGLLPKYTAGVYPLENSTLLVGRGLSLESTKIPRFFNPPELVIIDIEPQITS